MYFIGKCSNSWSFKENRHLKASTINPNIVLWYLRLFFQMKHADLSTDLSLWKPGHTNNHNHFFFFHQHTIILLALCLKIFGVLSCVLLFWNVWSYYRKSTAIFLVIDYFSSWNRHLTSACEQLGMCEIWSKLQKQQLYFIFIPVS